ncbi:MAG: DegT/DnrJ/EryC1/StrS aminotransferase family protein [Treponema sp.]|nr:DegT/DnrJ/EryC1/StrS aminotransferase family protein [Treponema sp.]
MIQTYSSTIRRKEMDAVLTCMVDEKIGPGELNARLIQTVKEFFKCDGAVALRSPAVALKYILLCFDLEPKSKIMISALAPAWHYQVIESLGYEPLVLDVQEVDGLVNAEIVHQGMLAGGRLLLLHETEGILPDYEAIMALGVPVIEDVSQSAGASVAIKNEDGTVSDARKKAGLFGVYSILGLEEKDVITAGGGAVLMAPNRREWLILKKFTDEAPLTDLLPDINSALAWVQLKEFNRNETTRREIFNMYQHSCMIGRHKTFARDMEGASTMCSFPLILNSSFKDVKAYTARKDIEIQLAFAGSVIALKDELSSTCIHAKSLLLRTAHFPLYPRLTQAQAAKVVKVLGTLP